MTDPLADFAEYFREAGLLNDPEVLLLASTLEDELQEWGLPANREVLRGGLLALAGVNTLMEDGSDLVTNFAVLTAAFMQVLQDVEALDR